jgi:YD repeat-containing protein
MGTAEPAATAGDWIISGAMERNGMGLVTRSWLPYQVTGDTWQAAPPGTGSVSITYDAVGRVVQKIRADGLVVATRRDGPDLIFSEQWPPGAATDMERQTFDAAGQLTSVSRNAGSHWVTQTYEYSPSGRATVVSLPNGLQASFYYDLLGRRIGHRSPDTGRTVYLLDACGNERLRTIATGQQIRTEVDAMNRVTGVYHDA